MKNTKRFIALLLTAVMVLSLLPVVALNVFAVTETEQTALEASGLQLKDPNAANSETNPYLINDEDDWKAFAALMDDTPTSGTSRVFAYDGTYFELTADLNFSAYDANGEAAGNGHESLIVGRSNNTSRYTAFSGSFDGKGHTIEGLNIISTTDFIGLFGTLCGATVKNVTLKNSTFTFGSSVDENGKVVALTSGGGKYMGGIAAQAVGMASTTNTYNTNIISNCVVEDSVLLQGGSNGRIGGILGDGARSGTQNQHYLYIENCVSAATITAISPTDNAGFYGGILGISSSNGSSDVQATISNCVSKATLDVTFRDNAGAMNCVGGIAGELNGQKATVENCYADVSITVRKATSANTVSIEGAGALVGCIGRSITNTTTITNSYGKMNFSKVGVTVPAGLLVGTVNTANATLTFTENAYDTTTTTSGLSVINGQSNYTATNRSEIATNSTADKKEDYRDAAANFMIENVDRGYTVKNTATATFTYEGSSLLLTVGADEVVLRHYFTMSEEGTLPTVTVNGEAATVNQKADNVYYIDITVAKANASAEQTVEGVTGITCTSVSAYATKLKTAAEAQGASETVKAANEAVQAFLAYANADIAE